MSLHGREEPPWLGELRYHSKIALFTDPHHNPNWIAQRLLDAGIKDRDLIIAEDLGLSTETIQRLSPDEIRDREFSPLNLVAIVPKELSEKHTEKQPWPALGLPEDAFQHQAGLITKMEVRAVALAYLQLQPELVLWDLGAGSGSVAIEATRLVPLRQVVAVEKNEGRYKDLVENVRRFQCGEIQVVQGNAADVVEDLPRPHRVFIGGSGDDLEEILHKVTLRLHSGGRVVQTVVTMNTLETVRSFWQNQEFKVAITQLQVNRSVPIGNSERLEAMNPVFIVTAQSGL
jgi:precorrin-6Y C5,15-methyltransferase (decarboxylating)